MVGRFLLLRIVALCLAGIGTSIAQTPSLSSLRLAIEMGAYSPPSPDGARTVSVRIRSTDDSGQNVITTRTNIQLQAFVFESASLVVSEISRDFEEFELTNVGEDALDLTDWSLRAGRGNDVQDSSRYLVGPAVLPAGGILRWSSRTNASNIFPNLAEPHRISRNGFSVIEVRNSRGELVDQVVANNTPRLAEMRWTGSPLVPVVPGTNGFVRAGSVNRFSALDWVSESPSLGTLNAKLSLPWHGARVPGLPNPSAVMLTNGLWEGVLTLPVGTSRFAQLSAGFGNGVFWDGAIERMPQTPALQLEVVSGSLVGSESNPGPIAVVRVRLPQPLVAGAKLPVTLSWSAPGEFESINEIILATGESSADFPVSALDDAVADGRSRVRLTARASGLLPSSLDFTLDDNESGTLLLSLPESAPEGGNRATSPSWVILPAPAIHDTEVSLTGTGRARSQSNVIVKAGSQSAQFDFRIDDDALINLAPFEEGIQALIPNWPPAVASIRVIDNEHPTYDLEIPHRVVEGIPQTARLHFPFSVDRAVEFRLRDTYTRLHHPETVHLLPGEKVIEFPLSLTDDQRITPNVAVSLLILSAEFGDRSASIELVDNDSPLTSLDVSINPIVFSSSPAVLRLQLRDAAQQPFPRDGTAELRLLSQQPDATLSPTSANVVLKNGVFEGEIRFEGEGNGVVLEAVFGSMTNRSNPFDLLPGRIGRNDVSDIASWPGRTNLLALQYRTNGVSVTGQLVELNPVLGSVVRALDLPIPASRIAVSETGQVAWIAGDIDTLFRVDLTGWKLERQLQIHSTSPVQQIVAIALSPGSTDNLALLALASDPANPYHFRLFGFQNGQQVPGDLVFQAVPSGADVIPGRSPGEFLAASARSVKRLILTDSGWSTAAERDLSSLPIDFATHPVLFGTALLFGDGLVLDATTLADLPDFAPRSGTPRRSAAIGFPELNCVLFAEDSYSLLTYDSTDRSLLGRRRLPLESFQNGLNPVDRLIRWGARGVALVSWDSKRLFFVDNAPRFLDVADLAIGVTAPGEVLLPENVNTPASVNALISVTNLGPAIASEVRISTSTFESIALDFIQPGEVRHIPRIFQSTQAGRQIFSASVSSKEWDAVTNNNTAATSILFTPAPWPDTLALHLPARHLMTSPDGKELWLAVGTDAPPEGIAVMDPTSGTRLRTLPVGADPQRLFLTPDARDLYVQLGTNRLVRWNLETASITLDRTFADETLLDVTILPEPRQRVAVVSQDRLTLLENETILQQISFPFASARGLGVQDGKLWVASPSDLRAYKINPGNLTLNSSRAVFVPSGNYHFVVQDNQLLFDGIVTLAEGGDYSYATSSGVPNIPEGSIAFGAYGDRLRRYQLPQMLPQAEVAAPSLARAGNLLDQVRWGTNGFAFRTDRDWLLSLRSPIGSVALANLALVIEGPESAIYNQPVEFNVIITNRGTASSLPFQLTLRVPAGKDISIPGRLSPTQGEAVLLIRDPIAPGGTLTLPLQATPISIPFPTGSLTVEGTISIAGGVIEGGGSVVSKTLTTRLLQADVGLSLGNPIPTGPLERTIRCTVSNHGPETILQPRLQVELSRGLTLLGMDKGALDIQCCGLPIIHQFATSLAPGETVQFNLNVRAAVPGMHSFRLFPEMFLSDPNIADNVARVGIHIPTSDGTAFFPNYTLPFSRAFWSTARNQWIAVQEAGLTLLAPTTLAPEGFFSFPQWAADFHLADGDQSVWIATDTRNATRYNLDTGAVEQTIQSHLTTGAAFGTIIPVPGHPKLLVIAGLDELGRMEVIAYNNGQLLPAKYAGDLQWTGAETSGAATRDLRVYISNGVGFRELELQADGLHLRRNLDGFEPGVDYVLAAANGLLNADFTPEGIRYIKNIPPAALRHPGPGQIGYEVYHSESGSRFIQSIDLKTARVVWELPIADGIGRQVAGGPGGVLFLGDEGGWLAEPANAGTDLELRAVLESTPLGIGNEFTVQLALRQSGTWRAANLKLKLDLPAGVSFVSPPDLQPDGTIQVPDFAQDLTMSILLRALAAGTHTLQFRLESNTPDPTPADTTAAVTVVVPAEPVLLLPDLTTSDNGSPLIFRLTERAPRLIKVQLQSELMDAQPNDLAVVSSEIEFPTGTQELRIPWIASDSRLEPDEHFRIRWIGGDVAAKPESSLITIANEDSVVLQVRSVTQAEGNNPSGATAVMSFQLNEAPALPVQVGFATRDGAATAGTDYKPVQGTVLFNAGQRTNSVVIPIISDLLWESTETFFFDLTAVMGVTLPFFPTTVTLQNDDLPSALALAIGSDDNGQILLQFQGQLGVQYVVQSTHDLTQDTWITEPEPLVGTGGSQTLRVDSPSARQRFFRVLAY